MVRKIEILYGLEAGDGGALKHLVSLVYSLDKTRFSITVILSTARSTRVFSEIDNMMKAGANVLIFPMEKGLRFTKDIQLIRKLIAHFKEKRYDIVHAHSSKAGLTFRIAAKISKIDEIIYTPHCFFFQSKRGMSRYFFILAERLLGSITTRLIVSITEQDWVLKYNLVSSDKLTVISNAIKPGDYLSNISAQDIKKTLGLQQDHFIVGGIGRLCKQKDWITFIYAAKEVILKNKNVIFLISGDGELQYQLNRLITKLNAQGNIILLGHVKEISNLYQIFDLFVSSSLWEGLPYALLESMHFKVPVIASDIGYKELLFDRHNAILFTPTDYKQLAKKITALIQNKSLRDWIGTNGYQTCNNFKFSTFIEEHERLYLSRSRQINKML